MNKQEDDFVEALFQYVSSELHHVHDMTYCREAIRILDARNHLFQRVGECKTDEAAGVYALIDLCMMNEWMETLPDRQRMQRVARNYWS